MAVAFSPGGDGVRNFRRNPHTSFAAASDFAKERDFTSHALRFPVDGMPRIDRISAPIVLSKHNAPGASCGMGAFDHLIRAHHEPGAGYRIDGDQSAGAPLLRKFNLRH